jgi:hypothetical protein
MAAALPVTDRRAVAGSPRCVRALHALLLVGALLAGAATAAVADRDEEARLIEAVWLLYGTLMALEQQGPSQSFRWLQAEIGLEMEQAGTLLAFSIESVSELSALADELHARNCRQLESVTPTMHDVTRVIEQTNAELAEFRRERVADMDNILTPASKQALMGLVRDQLLDAVKPPHLDVQAYLEGTGADAPELAREMCDD